MNVFIAIFGLALLILVHEAGHFFAALGVGMSPRKFYIGFPPALVKTKRKGIEYGIGAIPLGGYVKIPGMHRPAASDVDAHFAPARSERPELTIPIERLRRALDDDDLVAARAELSALEDALTTAELSSAAAHAAGRGVRELGGRARRRCVLAPVGLEADHGDRRRPADEHRVRADPLHRALPRERRGGDREDPDRPQRLPGRRGRAEAGRRDPRDRRPAGRAGHDRLGHQQLEGQAGEDHRRARRQARRARPRAREERRRHLPHRHRARPRGALRAGRGLELRSGSPAS